MVTSLLPFPLSICKPQTGLFKSKGWKPARRAASLVKSTEMSKKMAGEEAPDALTSYNAERKGTGRVRDLST